MWQYWWLQRPGCTATLVRRKLVSVPDPKPTPAWIDFSITCGEQYTRSGDETRKEHQRKPSGVWVTGEWQSDHYHFSVTDIIIKSTVSCSSGRQSLSLGFVTHIMITLCWYTQALEAVSMSCFMCNQHSLHGGITMQYVLHRFTILDVCLQCIPCNKRVCWLVKVIYMNGKGSAHLALNSGRTPCSISQKKDDWEKLIIRSCDVGN